LDITDEDEPEPMRKRKSFVLSVQDTPQAGKIQNLARSVRIGSVSRLRGRGTIPNKCNQGERAPPPRPRGGASTSTASVPLRQSQRLASRSSSEESLPDPRRPRVQCPQCKEWLRYTEVPIHVRDKHADLDLSHGMEGFSSSCKLSL